MSYYVVKYGETISDISVKLYGDASYVFDLIKWNSSLTTISDIGIEGLNLYYEPIIKSAFKPVTTSSNTVNKVVTIKEKQSIFDISLQIYGTTERVFDVLNLINKEQFTDKIVGKSFSYVFENTNVPVYFNTKKVNVSTLYENAVVVVSISSKNFQDSTSFEFQDGINYEFEI
jgi:hypothetical protein